MVRRRFPAVPSLYTPAADFFGTETFTYTVRDTGGLTATATVTVTVNNVNDPVDAVNDEFFVDEFTTNNQLDVLANDSPGPANEIPIDNLTITKVVTNAEQRWHRHDCGRTRRACCTRRTPTKFGPYTETFQYTMTDGQYSDTATVTVNVEPVIRPRARDDKYTVLEDSTNNCPGCAGQRPVQRRRDPDAVRDRHAAARTARPTIVGDNIVYTPSRRLLRHGHAGVSDRR